MPAVRGAYKGAVVRHPRRRLKLRRIHHLPAAAAAGKPSAQPPPPRSPADGTAGATRLGAPALGGPRAGRMRFPGSQATASDLGSSRVMPSDWTSSPSGPRGTMLFVEYDSHVSPVCPSVHRWLSNPTPRAPAGSHNKGPEALGGARAAACCSKATHR